MGGCIGCLKGPICTGLMLVVSLWGVFFMAVMGGLFYNESVGLLADLPEEDDKKLLWDDRIPKIKDLYRDNATNCWIACGAYVVVLIYSAARMYCIAR